MNENINLCEILKDCPKGTEFWSDNFGKVRLINVGTEWDTPIEVELSDGSVSYYTEEGWCNKLLPANCLLWPSKDCRDWSKWKCPKSKFDPKTLKAFDKIIVRDNSIENWSAAYFSHIEDFSNYDIEDSDDVEFIIATTGCSDFSYCIPFNDETKHLIGTSDEAPEYYRYWED